MKGRIKLRVRYNPDRLIDLICALSIIMIMPFFFSINSFINYGIRCGLGLCFLACVAIIDSALFIRLTAVLLSGFIYTILYMYNVRLAYGGSQASFITRSMLCWLYMTFAVYYAEKRKNTDNHMLGMVFTVIMLITIATSIIGIRRYSYLVSGYETIVRTLGNGGEFSDSARKLINRSNVASWQLAYGMALSSSAYMLAYRKYRNKLYLVTMASIVYFLIEAQITFALIFSVLPILHFFLKNRKNSNQIIVYLVGLLLCVLIYFNLSNILYILYEFMMSADMTMLGIRFYQLYEATKIGALVGTGAGRIDYYMMSLKQFINHPIIGYKLKDYSELYTKLGMHSQVFDTLGGTGIIGFMLYFFPLAYVIRSVVHSFRDVIDRSFINLSILILLVFMFTNPTTFTCEGYMTALCLPLWLMNEGKSLEMKGSN